YMVIAFEPSVIQLRSMLLLRPLLYRPCIFSLRQRNEVIEYFEALTFSPQTNNQDRDTLQNIIDYARDNMIAAFNDDISSNVYTTVVVKWLDLNAWNNLSNECIQTILLHFSDPLSNNIINRIDDIDQRLGVVYNFVIG
ncbi:hypothetical protein N9K75_02885, partial [bacterium]|nr:hypothetical protein [bacterium]